MKKVGYIATAIAIAVASAAHAADLPTTKPPPEAPPVSCFASFWTWLEASPADCPLSYWGFTVYATVDAGLGWESHGAGYNPNLLTGVSDIVNKQSGPRSEWLWTPNGLGQSVIGIKMSEAIPGLPGWTVIGTAETGFNPYWGYADAQRTQVQNNGKALVLQSANADSSRAGQWDNSQGFLGVSNPTYGTLIAGRVNSLPLDAINSYDPMPGAYAFSPFGYSGVYAGFGDTEAARINTAVKYQVNPPWSFYGVNFRGAALVEWGGYDQGNAMTSAYQGQIGADVPLWGGELSLDAVGISAKDVVSVSTFTGTCSVITSGPFKGQTACLSGIPEFYANYDVKATLSNNVGVALFAKYAFQPIPLTLSGGWGHLVQSNPSDTYPNGFTTIGGWDVPGTIPSTFPDASKLWPTQWISYTTYDINRVNNVFFVGAKYAVTPQVEVAGAFYYLEQANYSTTPCTGSGIHISSGSCAGVTDFISFLIDYHPIKRADLYAGVMISNVYGGLAYGYQVTQTINPTAGLRIKF